VSLGAAALVGLGVYVLAARLLKIDEFFDILTRRRAA
jgi:hypothetical protein